jgi:uncharacterized protein DUF6152
MGRKWLGACLMGGGLLLATGTALAHHSQSGEFDRNSPIEFTGVVKAIEWTNPHGYAQVEVKGPDGNMLIYRVELQAPNQLYRAGWRRDSVKPGTVVKFKGSRSWHPQSMNVSGQMTLPDGTIAFQPAAGRSAPSAP